MADQKFAIVRLYSHNYHLWKFKMEMLLIRERLWAVISKARPGTPSEEWLEKDEIARATIGLYVDDNQGQLIKKCESAKAAWDKLKQHHDQCSEVYLLKKLARLDLQEGGDVEEHLQVFNGLVQRIEDAGQELPDKLRVALLLVSLPESFDPLVTAIQQRPKKEITLDLVLSSLKAEAEKRRERGDIEGEKALRMKVDKSKRAGSDSKKKKRVCHRCGQAGHYWKQCPSLKSSSKTYESAKESGDEVVKAKKASASGGPLAWKVGQAGPMTWFIDSGASQHMTGNKKFFKKLKPAGDGNVMLANGDLADIEGIGKGRLVGMNGTGHSVDIVLSNVLYVPKLQSGLISVSKLTEKGFRVKFTRDRCEVLNQAGKVTALARSLGPPVRRRTLPLLGFAGHTVEVQMNGTP